MKLTNSYSCLDGLTGPRGSTDELGRRPAPRGSTSNTLATRTSSGPAAPQAARLEGLIPDLLGRIVNQVASQGSPLDLLAVHDTCRGLRNAVARDDHLNRRQQMVRQWAPLAAAQFASDAFLRASAAECAPLLPLLTPKQHAILMEKVLADYSTFIVDREMELGLQGRAVSHMAKGLAHLDDSLQAALVARVTSFDSAEHVATALHGFAGQLAHLGAVQRNELIAKAVSLEPEWRGVAIDALGTRLDHLDASQQQALLMAAIGLDAEGDRGHVIAGLCRGLRHLGADQRETLFGMAAQIPTEKPLLAAAANLGQSLAALSADQRNTLVTLALRPAADVTCQRSAMCGLAAGLGHLEPELRDRLVTGAIAQLDGNEKAAVITALGAGLQHLTTAQHDKLLDAAAGLADGDPRAHALAGLAVGLGFLDPSQKSRVVGMALQLSTDAARAQALAALGKNLGHLTEGQHDALVNAAIRLFQAKRTRYASRRNRAAGRAAPPLHVQAVRDAIADLSLRRLDGGGGFAGADAIKRLAAGMGAGLGVLRQDSRHALVDTVTGMSRPGDKLYGGPAEAAAAIAGLGAGLQHLDPTQHEALIAAASRLAADPAATAIVGLGEGLQYLDPARQKALIAAAHRFRVPGTPFNTVLLRLTVEAAKQLAASEKVLAAP